LVNTEIDITTFVPEFCRLEDGGTNGTCYHVHNMQEGRERGNLFHIFILFSLAVAWPLFEQTAQSPEFFIARRSGATDLIFLVLTLVLFIPGFFVFLIWCVKRWNQSTGKLLHMIVLFLLFAFLFLIPFHRTLNVSWPISITICLTAALLIILGYNRYSSVRTFISFLMPAVLVVPAVFLTNDSISKLIIQKKISFPQIEVQSSTPVVLLVFDEFPLTSLLKDAETIDEKLYPNFASLTKTMTWYRNATTITDFTTYAIPAILTGKFPRKDELPTVFDHPSNLFTALGHNYDLIAIEEGERLLPVQFDQLKKKDTGLIGRLKSILSDLTILYLHMIFPRDIRDRLLPPVDHAWANFGNAAQNIQGSTDIRVSNFQKFVESIRARQRPTLFYLHTMLPHQPWSFLPSGKIQNCQAGAEVDGYKGFFQCHLLTVGYVDRLVGILIKRLKDVGIYEDSLIIITADHGASFQIGQARRAVRNNNFRDIMLIPLFIKIPHQTRGEINDLNVWTIDVLPTIADVLDTEFPWMEGLSVLDPAIQKRTSKQFFSGANHLRQNFEPLMRANPETIAAQKHIIETQSFQLVWQR
jgi:hypothetical protein